MKTEDVYYEVLFTDGTKIQVRLGAVEQSFALVQFAVRKARAEYDEQHIDRQTSMPSIAELIVIPSAPDSVDLG